MKINQLLSFITSISVLLTSSIFAKETSSSKDETSENIFDLTVKDINGKEVKLSVYKGKVLLIVNVASKCGYTKQYAGLEAIYEKYRDKGFEILAFPCNDFGGQEPGTNEEIQEFCSSTYNVKFKLFDKVKVLGEEQTPLYSRLTNSKNVEPGNVKWNFEKFLINKDGNIVSRYRSKVTPESEELTKAIEKELAHLQKKI
ncbi:MAG: Peroxiredoxin [Ignavibacteria bacterium]|nr:MAG: Peroxiredoxin [Ignavibacteria bacterium]KAF0161424.1 MAG: Peroxiredoxin [Ignavibacteria bacterium]